MNLNKRLLGLSVVKVSISSERTSLQSSTHTKLIFKIERFEATVYYYCSTVLYYNFSVKWIATDNLL